VTFESFIESLGSLVDLILVVVVQYYIFAVVAMNLFGVLPTDRYY
jgi:hypothetical protein